MVSRPRADGPGIAGLLDTRAAVDCGHTFGETSVPGGQMAAAVDEDP